MARFERFSWIGSNRQVSEIAWFLLVGGLSALLYIVISAGLTTLGVRPSIALLMTLVLLVPPTYLAQHRLTFQSDVEHLVAFPRYVTTQLMGNAVGLLGTAMFASAIQRQPFLAFTIIAVGVASLNYGWLKLWAFRR
jgi:putative flippase GtrA